MRAVVNSVTRPGVVPAPAQTAPAFHATLPGYAPTPLRALVGDPACALLVATEGPTNHESYARAVGS